MKRWPDEASDVGGCHGFLCSALEAMAAALNRCACALGRSDSSSGR